MSKFESLQKITGVKTIYSTYRNSIFFRLNLAFQLLCLEVSVEVLRIVNNTDRHTVIHTGFIYY